MNKERSQTVARDAFDWMAERNIPPTPENFELAYNFVSGDNPGLKHAVEAAGDKFDAPTITKLRKQFFAPPDSGDVMVELSQKISDELGSVLQLIETAGRDQSAYGKTLSQASGELGHAKLGEAGIKTMVDKLIGATRAMEARSLELEAKLKSKSDKVAFLEGELTAAQNESLTDQLTGIRNRKAFDSALLKSIRQAIENSEPLSLIMCDIDHFKKFNDTWGHQTGDQVLRLVANVLSDNVKGRDTAARYGGEEFVVILPQTELSGATHLADQIRGKVETKKLVKKSTGDVLGSITISAGVSQYDPNESAEDFVQRADECLYAAKRGGRNRVVNRTNNAVLQDAGVAAA